MVSWKTTLHFVSEWLVLIEIKLILRMRKRRRLMLRMMMVGRSMSGQVKEEFVPHPSDWLDKRTAPSTK